jgi:Zn-finger nucleic acid-binding protein
MFAKKCPSCGATLGNYVYADVCPHCREVLKDNLPLANVVHAKAATVRAWPVRAFYSVRDFVES